MAKITWDGDVGIIRQMINGRQRNIRWSGMSKSATELANSHIALLALAARSNEPVTKATAKWLMELPDKYHKKLVRLGLAEPRISQTETTLGPFIDSYLATRQDLKPNSLRNMKNVKARLTEYFTASKQLARIGDGDADGLKQHLINKYAMPTVSKTLKYARQFFRAAQRKGLVDRNPFLELKVKGGERNDSRLHFIERETIESVIDACGDNEWKLLIALSRYGGLRCPSEHLNLRWEDIDWKKNKITINAPKTGIRIIPLFNELRPYLETAWETAPPKSEFVIRKYRDTNSNLRTQFLRIIKRAKVKPWERLFQNLRASRQIELGDLFPAHVVSDWIGNSPRVAMEHYYKTRDEHFRIALQLTGDDFDIDKAVEQLLEIQKNNPELWKTIDKKLNGSTAAAK